MQMPLHHAPLRQQPVERCAAPALPLPLIREETPQSVLETPELQPERAAHSLKGGSDLGKVRHVRAKADRNTRCRSFHRIVSAQRDQ